MMWRGPLASVVLGFGLAALGCDCEEACVCSANSYFRPNPLETGDTGNTLQVRAQAPDKDKPVVQTSLQQPMPEPTVGVTAARVRAVVNGEAILDEELDAMTLGIARMLMALPEPERTQKQTELRTEALNTLIEREIVLQDMMFVLKKPGNEKNLDRIKEMTEKEFEKSWLRPLETQHNLKSDDELKAFLKLQGTSLEMQKRLWTRKFMAEQYLQQRIYPIFEMIFGHVQVVEYYERHPEQFKIEDEVHWQELFIAAAKYQTREAAQRMAEQLAQRVRQGEDFAKLCEQFDDGDSRYRKGDGLGRKRGEIKPPEIEAALFNLKEGDITVLEQTFGFRVVRLVKRQNAGMMPFDEKTQKLIKDKIRNEIMDREIKRFILELKRDAVIEVYK